MLIGPLADGDGSSWQLLTVDGRLQLKSTVNGRLAGPLADGDNSASTYSNTPFQKFMWLQLKH